ncbi:pseudouridine synthase [Teredinibacter haidensis]|uniref:pseudouridine synthase n=1 Tax=Teredinibacter haidensis TaxID=2731755 RepID=UPI000948BEDD|nr:16S rRNA pseudouridine(516) synthase [Teredinibacter haidensis]
MKSTHSRLDRLISQHTQTPLGDVRLLLAKKQITVDGSIAHDRKMIVNQFSHITLSGEVLQDKKPRYIMLNKPKAVVCATTDKQHKTVIDLLNTPNKNELHIAGRLDFNSTGIVLLTNDGTWSRALFSPENHITKHYQVTLSKPITDGMVKAFSQGIYFAYEKLTTRPAKLTPTNTHTAIVELVEGRYHQIKRMFGHFQSEVLTLHRFRVGNIMLRELDEAGYRDLTKEELEQ